MSQSDLQCRVVGIGAWGPGFNDWPSLQTLLRDGYAETPPAAANPAPQIIPANERRRAPLPVKIAVEVSWQALQQSGLAASDVACVFGSGLGDTEITDYMCRVLTTELKQLSPTKFHNSVHNAAAGYWTISTGCMKSANSIAAYHQTAGLALFEGISQCVAQQEPVLITLFDTEAHATYRQIFSCTQNFGAALLIEPVNAQSANNSGPVLTLTDAQSATQPTALADPFLENLAATNPAAGILKLLNLLAQAPQPSTTQTALAIGPARAITLRVESQP
jgi:hypothetical protein